MKKDRSILKDLDGRIKALEKLMGMGGDEIQNVHFLITMTRNIYQQGEYLQQSADILTEFLKHKELYIEFETWLEEKHHEQIKKNAELTKPIPQEDVTTTSEPPEPKESE